MAKRKKKEGDDVEGAHVQLPLKEVKETLADDSKLKAAIARELFVLGQKFKIDASWLLPLVDGVVKEVRKRTDQMQANPEEVPPPNVNTLSVQIVMPTVGRVGVSAWESKAVV